ARAEANLALAKKAVNDTFDVAKEHPLLQKEGMHPVRRLLLEKALPFYKRFHEARGDDPAARAELADQWFRVAYITTEVGNKTEAPPRFRPSGTPLSRPGEVHPLCPRVSERSGPHADRHGSRAASTGPAQRSPQGLQAGARHPPETGRGPARR